MKRLTFRHRAAAVGNDRHSMRSQGHTGAHGSPCAHRSPQGGCNRAPRRLRQPTPRPLPLRRAASVGASAEGAASKGLTCLADAYNGKMKGTKVTMTGPFTDEDAVKFANSIKAFEDATGITIEYQGSKEFEASITMPRCKPAPPRTSSTFRSPACLGTFFKQGKVVPVTKLVPESWLQENYKQSWLDMATMTGADGNADMSGLWQRFNGKSLVWYPKKAFDDAGYTVPTTWEELLALQDQIAADGDTPWCVGIESGAATGWPATDWTEELMLRTTSPDNYDKWVKGELNFASPEVKKAIETFADIWNNDKMRLRRQGRHRHDASSTIPPLPMFENPPKCWLHRRATSSLPSSRRKPMAGRGLRLLLLPARR